MASGKISVILIITCVTAFQTVRASAKDVLLNVKSVTCPDGHHYCRDGQTCCKVRATGAYTTCCGPQLKKCCPSGKKCCPVSYNCCPGETFCCPRETRCNVPAHRCERNDGSVIMWWMMPGTVKREKTLGTRLKTTGAAVNAGFFLKRHPGLRPLVDRGIH